MDEPDMDITEATEAFDHAINMVCGGMTPAEVVKALAPDEYKSQLNMFLWQNGYIPDVPEDK